MAYLIRWLMLKWIIFTSCLYWERETLNWVISIFLAAISLPHMCHFNIRSWFFAKCLNSMPQPWCENMGVQSGTGPPQMCCVVSVGNVSLMGAESSDNLSWTESLDEESLQRFLYRRGANQKKTSLWEMSLPLGIFSRREVAGNTLKILMLSLCNCDDISPFELI